MKGKIKFEGYQSVLGKSIPVAWLMEVTTSIQY